MRKADEVDREVAELRHSIKATRTHGVLYYLLLVAVMFVGFAIGYATHSLIGAAIIIAGLALIAWREVSHIKTRTTVLSQLLNEKLMEQRHLEERQKEFEIRK
ncbi:MAG: hypothetical protein HY231_21195 [Acidobacteria bacterium]|nr:hypothetical protein [Acidobacteriota bacterium]